MYYRLTDQHRLRGWQHATCTIANRAEKMIKTVDTAAFSLLLSCDGVTEMHEELLTAKESEYLNNFLEQGIIERVQSPCPLNPEQQYLFYPNRYFDSILWSVTGRCNFRCRHCYMDAPHGKDELPLETVKDILRQLKECGIYHVTLTGGEPFVRKDFWEIVDYILEQNMFLDKIYTNGWLLTANTFDQFAKRRIRPAISISFDVLGWHDWMRGVQNAEARTIEAIKRCVENRYPIDIEYCLHNGNREVLRPTINYLAELGVPDIKIGLVQNTPLWEKNAEGYAMSRQEYYDTLLEYVPEYFEDGKPTNVLLGGAIHLLTTDDNYRVVIEKSSDEKYAEKHFLCGAARSHAYISPEGRFLPCMPITSCDEQRNFPLISEIGVRQCMSDSYYVNFVGSRVETLLKLNRKCGDCKYRYRCCGGCRAIAMLDNDGDLYASDPEACFLFENGYPEKFRKAADDAVAKYCKKET